MSLTPISEAKRKAGLPTGCLGTIGAIFAIVGLVAFWATGVKPLLLYFAAQSWVQTPCIILTSELEEIRGDDGSTWRAKFTYEYEVANATYTGNRDSIYRSSGSRYAARKRIEALPIGSKTTCWHCPSDPAESLLNREISYTQLGLAFGLLGGFTGIGCWMVFYAAHNRHRKGNLENDREEIRNLLSSPTATTSDEDELDRLAAVPQQLVPSQTKLARLVVMLIVCLFWNGAIGFFIWQFFRDKPFGNAFGNILLALFFVPFVLIGLAIFVALIEGLLTMFNSPVRVALSSGAVPRGGELDIAWELKGGLTRVRKLTVSIIGNEVATYVQGTDTHTDQSTFEIIHVVTTDMRSEIQFGTRTIMIPQATMHSLDLEHNKIRWTVRVHGEIRWWPDINDEFAFRVSPRNGELLVASQSSELASTEVSDD